MKPLHLVKIIRNLILAGVAGLALSSCVASNAGIVPLEYRSGKQASEAVAKQDAMKNHCMNTSPGYRLSMFKNRSKHLDVMGKKYSASYMAGFKNGYEDYYIQYMDMYCGDRWDRKRIMP